MKIICILLIIAIVVVTYYTFLAFKKDIFISQFSLKLPIFKLDITLDCIPKKKVRKKTRKDKAQRNVPRKKRSRNKK